MSLLPGTLRFYGRGFYDNASNSDGNLRTHGLYVEQETSDVITTDNGDGVATCHGDSGGPLVLVVSTPAPTVELELVTGVFSRMDVGSSGDACASESSSPFIGDNSRFSRVCKPGQTTWINNAIGHGCATVSAAGVPSHLRCFDLPFVEDVGFEGMTQGEEVALVVAIQAV